MAGMQPPGMDAPGMQPPGMHAGEGSESAAQTVPQRMVFFVIQGESALAHFKDAYKHPDEQLAIELNLYDLVATKWRPNEFFEESEAARPRIANGFAYIASTEDGAGGVSGSREPFWPKELNAEVSDGALTWRCIAPGSHGIIPISSPEAGEVAPSGLAIADVSVSENHKILLTYTGGEADVDYIVPIAVVIDSKTRVLRHKVRVRTE